MKSKQTLKTVVLEQLRAASPASLPMDLIRKGLQLFGCKFTDRDLILVLEELLAHGLIVEFGDDSSYGLKRYSLA
ncbi:MAG: hypothetical protein LBH49_03970 [Puniceicoccales bacterium]|jgi:hypothetical protein|nr:hypothetical protein [Puniceicoccales bacterium]